LLVVNYTKKKMWRTRSCNSLSVRKQTLETIRFYARIGIFQYLIRGLSAIICLRQSNPKQNIFQIAENTEMRLNLTTDKYDRIVCHTESSNRVFKLFPEFASERPTTRRKNLRSAWKLYGDICIFTTLNFTGSTFCAPSCRANREYNKDNCESLRNNSFEKIYLSMHSDTLISTRCMVLPFFDRYDRMILERILILPKFERLIFLSLFPVLPLLSSIKTFL
jgi:hypothetical protein